MIANSFDQARIVYDGSLTMLNDRTEQSRRHGGYQDAAILMTYGRAAPVVAYRGK